MKNTFGVFGIVVASLVAIGLIVAAVWAITYYTADTRGKISANERIKADPNFRIAAYDQFFNLCSAIQGDEGRIASQQELLDSATTDEERRQVRTTIAAIKGSRLAKINRYNADAARNYTVGQFRDSDLPYRLNPNDKETTCAL